MLLVDWLQEWAKIKTISLYVLLGLAAIGILICIITFIVGHFIDK
nr:MAG TPA: Mature oligodendrocyte transmembrane protein [Caudoviricetes sp.]